MDLFIFQKKQDSAIQVNADDFFLNQLYTYFLQLHKGKGQLGRLCNHVGMARK